MRKATGGVKFAHHYEPSPQPWSNTISSVTKDNLILHEYTHHHRTTAPTT